MGEYSKCNVCGVPESDWVDGKCRACGNGRYCDMDADSVMEQRAYDWFMKNNLLFGGMVYKNLVREKVEAMLERGKSVPRYIQQYLFES